MSALEKYRSEMLYAMGGDNRYHIDPRTAVELAAAAIAELEAENKRLRCCGNCGSRRDYPPRVNSDGHFCHSQHLLGDDPWTNEDACPSVRCDDHCHFTPSCWAARPLGGHLDVAAAFVAPAIPADALAAGE